jgi:hypothetical protein
MLPPLHGGGRYGHEGEVRGYGHEGREQALAPFASHPSGFAYPQQDRAPQSRKDRIGRSGVVCTCSSASLGAAYIPPGRFLRVTHIQCSLELTGAREPTSGRVRRWMALSGARQGTRTHLAIVVSAHQRPMAPGSLSRHRSPPTPLATPWPTPFPEVRGPHPLPIISHPPLGGPPGVKSHRKGVGERKATLLRTCVVAIQPQ